MVFNALSALGASQPELYDAFQLGASVAGRSASLAGIRNAVAPRNESVPTVNLFIDAASPKQEYAVSIINACVDSTVYALQCTAGPVTATGCGPNGPVITLTEGPSTYSVSTATGTRTAGHDVSATLQESCSLQGTTAAVCAGTLGGSVDKTTTSKATTTTYSGTDYLRFDVAVTGGAEKTANPTACAGSGGKSAAAGLSTRTMAVWSLIGAIGVAGFLGC